MGVSIALPLLEAMCPAHLRAGEPKVVEQKRPTRFAALYMPNGTYLPSWTPAREGPLAELPEILQPLAPVKGDVLVLSGLWNQLGTKGDAHYSKESSWLTGTKINNTRGTDINVGGISLDQLAARHVGQHTKLASIELATEATGRGVDEAQKTTRLYGGHISWSSPTTPAPKELDPRNVFNRLFLDQLPAGTPGNPSHRQSPTDDASILDVVLQERDELKSRIGVSDQHKLDDYLTAVREVERRLQGEAAHSTERRTDPMAIQALPALREDVNGYQPNREPHLRHTRTMLDLITLAFWTDTTRIATFMFGNALSTHSFTFLPGVTTAHHEASHHQNRPERISDYCKIGAWHVEQFAYLVGRLRAIKEIGGGTLLDSTMILFGSGLEDGNRHTATTLPILLGGGAGVGIRSGRHIAFPKGTPLCNLHLGILARLGILADGFGDSTGHLKQLQSA